MVDSFRALCGELTDKLHQYAETFPEHDVAPLVQRARDLLDLDEPEGEGLTDEELLELERVARDLQWCARGWEPKAMLVGNVRASEIEELCSAFLTRWGNPTPQPPADGEVAELVGWLRGECASEKADGNWVRMSVDRVLDVAALLQRQHLQPPADGEVAELVEVLTLISDGMSALGHEWDSWFVARAAELLQRQHPQPVPVSERLPGPEDCDAQGRCWLLTVEDEYPQWRLHSIEGAQPGGAMIWVPVDSSPGVMVDCFYTSHWLPARALPLPAGEALSNDD